MVLSPTFAHVGPGRDDRAAIGIAIAGSLLLHVAVTLLPARPPALAGHALDAPPTALIAALLVTTPRADLTAPAVEPGASTELKTPSPAVAVKAPVDSPAVPGLPRARAMPAPVALPPLPVDRRVVSAQPIVRGAVTSSVVTRAVPDYHGLAAAHADAIAPYRASGADVPPQVPIGFAPPFPAAEFDGGFERQLGAVVLVRADGNVDDVLIDRDLEAFREAVDIAVRGTQFIPATRSGVPVAGWMALRFDFLILGSAPEIRKMVSEARR
jgi:hypothetical protein